MSKLVIEKSTFVHFRIKEWKKQKALESWQSRAIESVKQDFINQSATLFSLRRSYYFDKEGLDREENLERIQIMLKIRRKKHALRALLLEAGVEV